MSKVFDARLHRHYDELKWLYCELYHNDMDSFGKLIEILREGFASRSLSLKRLDAKRMKQPDWYKRNDLLGMCIYTEQFAGTLRGVREKLDYLQDAGVNYLHMMPLLDTVEGRSDGGYAVADFRKVRPDLGTMEDLEDLTSDCHRRGLVCCLDFVMNHTSQDHEWAKKARAGDPYYQDYYFFFDNWDIPNEYEKTVPQVFPTTAPGNFTWLEDMGKVVMTFFHPYQWDLNYQNPNLFNAMAENMLFLANRGIDVLRVDAVPYIWKQLGTNCRNLPQVHTIVRMFRMISEIVCPGVLLLGEVVMEPKELAPYFGPVEKPECHMLYNATTMCTTWHTVATRDTRLLQHQMDQLASLPREYVFLNYLRCHDDIGWGLDFPFLRQFGMEEVPHKKYLNNFFAGDFPGSFARGERYNDDPRLGDARMCGTTASLSGIEAALESGDSDALRLAVRLDLMLHAFMLTQSGVPILYAGDEIGQLNDYSYHDDPEKAEDSRYVHRGSFPWDLAEERANDSTWRGWLFQRLRSLELLRQRYDVFCTEAEFSTFDAGDTRLLGLRRSRNGQTLTAIFNFSEAEITASADEIQDSLDLISGRGMDRNSVVLQPYRFLWLLHT